MRGNVRDVTRNGAVVGLVLAVGVFLFFQVRISKMVDGELERGIFAGTLDFYAAPDTLVPGYKKADAMAALERAGYTEAPGGAAGWIEWRRPEKLIIHASAGRDAEVRFSKDQVAGITGPGGSRADAYVLEPALLTNVSSENRERRRLVRFSDIPKVLVDAVTCVEDKRFFAHMGFDLPRIAKAAWVDLRFGRKQQGASTLTMQLARSLWLDPDKTWRRKATEVLMTMELEEKLTKEQIFEHYANQVYLGGHATFSLHGFGAASEVFFGKELRQISLPEAALLAGMIQRPNVYNPGRFPQRARARRNLVLALMAANGRIPAVQLKEAAAEPVEVKPGETESVEAGYFFDAAAAEARVHLKRARQGRYKVYTTLDGRLQNAAVEAVRAGMKEVDAIVRKKRGPQSELPQVALVALDPRTGDVKALVGGRDYEASQLNRAAARRPPGSAFKPFVYAAALSGAVEGSSRILTPASLVVDEPTSFEFGETPYAPGNFEGRFYGQVTLRRALARSMNVATIKVAEMT